MRLHFHAFAAALFASALLASQNAWAQSPAPPKPWVHVELGAGNYGFRNRYLGINPLFIGGSETQYLILEKTLDEMVKQHGPRLIFYINDYYSDVTQYAVKKLEKFRQKRGYDQVEIRPWVADFLVSDPPYASSMHLKNPEWGLLQSITSGSRLQALANRSETGLEITSYFGYHLREIKKKPELKARFQGRGKPYYYPNGSHDERRTSRLHIAPEHSESTAIECAVIKSHHDR